MVLIKLNTLFFDFAISVSEFYKFKIRNPSLISEFEFPRTTTEESA